MKTPRIKFVFFFLIFAFIFLFGIDSLLDQPPGAIFGAASQVGWQAALFTMLAPVKIVLIGPLLPFIIFLHQEPDTSPAFFLVGFSFYWTILALIFHYSLSKIKYTR